MIAQFVLPDFKTLMLNFILLLSFIEYILHYLSFYFITNVNF